MSSRVLKKIKAADDLSDLKKTLDDLAPQDEDNEAVQHFTGKPPPKQQKAKNLFALLDTEETDSASQIDDHADSVIEDEDCAASNEATKSKGKKKRKKKKGRKKVELEDARRNNPGEDDIDQSVREINLLYGLTEARTEAASSNSDVTWKDFKPLLGVERRHLNADNEMKRRFGSDVVRGERRPNQNRHTYKPRSTWMVTGRQEWTAIGKSGLSMKLISNDKGVILFSYEHSTSYQQLQFQFYDAVESMDPNNIAGLLQQHPYHIDSLLQLSEICKTNEDYQQAAQLIERTLYILETSMHTLFNMAQGNCRLPYKQAENRSLFLALFRHLNTIALRGCHRTALEFCKLLLSFDPSEDPLCVLLMIDFFALKSGEFQYLIRLYQEWNPIKNLSQLPNFAYSVAMAMFLDGQDGADEKLQHALIMFPSCLPLLMEQCGVELSDNIAKHNYFATINSETDSLQLLCRLFAGRNHSLWKDEQVIDWLVRNAQVALESVAKETEMVKKGEQLRLSLYRGTPRNVYRHVLISEIPFAVRSLPGDITSQPLLSHDPLPPLNSIAGYARPLRRQAGQSDGDLFSLFFRSLLPSFSQNNAVGDGDVQQFARDVDAHAQGADGENAHDDDNNVAALRRRAGQVIGAMQNLLNTLTYRGDLVEDEDEAEREEGDWD